MMNLEIFIRRRRRVFLSHGSGALSAEIVGALLKNLESLGWTLSPDAIERLQTLSIEELTRFYEELIPPLRALVGAHRKWKPMYPNFPTQVMEMSEAHLYINSLIHYWTNRLPQYAKAERLPLLDKTKLQVLDLGTRKDFDAIFTTLASTKTAPSDADKADLAWFVENGGDAVFSLLPTEIPSREMAAILGALFCRHTARAEEFLRAHLKTATDVLRVAVAWSEGDVSLAAPGKFKTLPRPLRRAFLRALEEFPNALEDMLRWKNRWLRLGEKLHPGEFQKQFPKSFAAFQVVRGDAPVTTFNSRLERALQERDAPGALQLLQTRPGDFARRLDHLLRLDDTPPEIIEAEFERIAPRVSTPVLLQLLGHFKHRQSPPALRTIFPKGNVAKVQGIVNTLPPLPDETIARCICVIENTLRARFAELAPLENCYLDPQLKDFPIPFATRSTSRALRTLPRGSRLALPDCSVLRFFIWWTNGRARTDIDLSAALFGDDFLYRDVVSYYNLKNFGGHHSGDIVDAPNGAAEFIDLNIERTIQSGARYVVMSVNSYTDQPFCELPECFAGWMARTHANSGEIFEARTVENRVDLAADTRIALPLIIDLHARQVLWTDIALRRYPSFNNVQNNLSGVSLMLRAMTSLSKTTLHDLFDLHIQARGTRISERARAQQIFALDEGLTPFDGDIIAGEWM